MTIYEEDGSVVETVPLHVLEEKGKEAMHALMLEKGFVLKAPQEVEQIQQEQQAQYQKEKEDH